MRVETGLHRRVAGFAERGQDGSSVGCEFFILLGESYDVVYNP